MLLRGPSPKVYGVNLVSFDGAVNDGRHSFGVTSRPFDACEERVSYLGPLVVECVFVCVRFGSEFGGRAVHPIISTRKKPAGFAPIACNRLAALRAAVSERCSLHKSPVGVTTRWVYLFAASMAMDSTRPPPGAM